MKNAYFSNQLNFETNWRPLPSRATEFFNRDSQASFCAALRSHLIKPLIVSATDFVLL